ncbi:uncharacterized protein [Arachis hypogaea]|uniref:uncharacterized protein n=1 Tax=Arachis hypogaea TaxID=3818 RepID=UPI003B21F50D
MILRTPISTINKEDRLIWPKRMDGVYTIKTGYQCAKKEKEFANMNQASSSVKYGKLWKKVWGMQVPQKIKMFSWKACHNIIAVNANLYKKKLTKCPLCRICEEKEETVEHAILLCNWTRAAWFGAQVQCLPTYDSVKSFAEWLKKSIQKIREEGKEMQDELISRLGFLCWSMWKSRNQYVFQNIGINPKSTIIRAAISESEYKRAIDKVQSIQNNRTRERGRRVTWIAPPKDWLKINIDASFCSQTGRAVTTAVVRNWKGSVITGSATKIITNSSLSAEAYAFREALIMAQNLQFDKSIIETDCQALAQALKSKGSIGEIDAIIRDIQNLITEISQIRITWVPREGNKLAHTVAKLADGDGLNRSWTCDPPQQLKNIIREDRQKQPS